MPAATSDKPSIWSNKSVKYITISAVIFIVGFISAYFYWSSLPESSISHIESAIKNKDVEAFEKYVDLDSTINNSLDELIRYKLTNPYDIQDDNMNKLMLNFYNMAKPKVGAIVEQEIKTWIETGKFESIKSAPIYNADNATTQEMIFKNYIDSILQNIIANSFSPGGVESINKNDDTATMGLRINYPKLNHSDILEISLQQTDADWKITGLTNLNNFLVNLAAAKREKLAEINKPTADKISQALKVNQINLNVFSGENFTPQLSFSVQITFLSETPISSISGVLTVRDQSDRLLVKMPVNAQTNTAKNQTSVITWQKNLNPFLVNDAVIVHTPFGYLKTNIEWQQIIFANGTELKLADKII